MGFLSKWLDQNTAETVDEVQSKIHEMNAEESRLRRLVEEIDVRRGAHLRTGDHEALKADAQSKADAELGLESISLARVELTERLDAARDRARLKTIENLQQEKPELIQKLRRAMLAAVAANEAAAAFHQKAVDALGQSAQILFPSFAFPLLRREMLDPWQLYVDQLDGPKPRPASPVVAVRAVDRAVKAVASTITPKAKPRRESLPPAVKDGKSRVVFLRSGVELPDGTLSSAGDVVDLPATLALNIVQRGAGDFVASDTVSADVDAPAAADKGDKA